MDYADMELMRTVITVAMVALVAILPRETAVQYHAHKLLLLKELSFPTYPTCLHSQKHTSPDVRGQK